MRKIISLLFIFTLIVSCKESTKSTEIYGSIQNNEVGLISIVGSEFEQDLILKDDGSFTSNLDLPYDGYYNLIIGRRPMPLYLEKGKSFGIEADMDNFNESLAYLGDLKDENAFLSSKRSVMKDVNLEQLYREPADNFLNSVTHIEREYNKVLNESGIENSKFINSEKNEFLYQKLAFLNNYPSAHKYLMGISELHLPEYYIKEAESINLTDVNAYTTSDAYKQMVQSYIGRKVNELPEDDLNNSTMHHLKLVNEMFPEGHVKNTLLKGAVGFSLKADKHLNDVYELYKSYQTNEEYLNEMEESYASLSKLTPGSASPTFDYENYNGGSTSLEDLKGKFVYIDVWATWCGPCINEIPFMKEVEAKYRDKNIEFVGMSIDNPEAYDKWREMVEEKELVGVQIYADNAWQSQFVQDYRIMGIPRFILIDPEGNIYDADTYRPSDPKLSELFDKLLI